MGDEETRPVYGKVAMRTQAGLIVLAAALLLPVAAVGATAHDSFDVAGTVFACPTHTYTITSGAIVIVAHDNVDATGTTHFTFTQTTSDVQVIDEDGNAYAIRGTIWFGGRDDEILTATHMLNIVGRGGVADSIKLVERFRNGELISHEFGSCEGL